MEAEIKAIDWASEILETKGWFDLVWTSDALMAVPNQQNRRPWGLGS